MSTYTFLARIHSGSHNETRSSGESTGRKLLKLHKYVLRSHNGGGRYNEPKSDHKAGADTRFSNFQKGGLRPAIRSAGGGGGGGVLSALDPTRKAGGGVLSASGPIRKAGGGGGWGGAVQL